MKKIIFSAYILLGIGINTYAESIQLYFSGGSNGQLEAVNQLGGLEAHAAFFQSAINEPTPSIIIEAGGFFPDTLDNPIDQANAEIYSKAINQMPYQVVGLSAEDLSLGRSAVEKLLPLIEKKFLVTNLTVQDQETELFDLYTIVDAGEISIGFLSLPILNEGMALDEGNFITEHPNNINTLINQLKEENLADLVVLISMQPPAAVLSWLNEYEGTKPDLIVSKNLDIRVQKPKEIWMSNVPANSNSIAKITLKLTDEKQIESVEYERIALHAEDYYNDEMRDFLLDQYDHYVEELDLAVSEPYPLMQHELEQDYMAGYKGVDSCFECHQDIYEQWANTKHATAFEELFKTNRHWVPEQVVYRVTGYGHSNGYDNMADSAHLRGVQCETCHGPGQVHIDEYGTGEIRVQTPKALCLECHTDDWDPEFEGLFDLYYKQIEH